MPKRVIFMTSCNPLSWCRSAGAKHRFGPSTTHRRRAVAVSGGAWSGKCLPHHSRGAAPALHAAADMGRGRQTSALKWNNLASAHQRVDFVALQGLALQQRLRDALDTVAMMLHEATRVSSQLGVIFGIPLLRREIVGEIFDHEGNLILIVTIATVAATKDDGLGFRACHIRHDTRVHRRAHLTVILVLHVPPVFCHEVGAWSDGVAYATKSAFGGAIPVAI